MKTLELGKSPLTLEDIKSVALDGRKVRLSKGARDKILTAHRFLLEAVETGETFYGINTGFGLLSNVKISNEKITQLQKNYLRSHSAGVGTPLESKYVRAMLLLRANTLTQGHSGVHVKTVEQILKLLNENIHPIVPEQGSVGASGDLAPLAHLASVLVGEGEAIVDGKRMKGATALKKRGIKPIVLGPKEALALTNGTQFMCAIGTLALLEAEELCNLADMIGAMTLEALQGTTAAFDPKIHEVRPHPGQIESARRVRVLLGDGKKSEISSGHENCEKVQDAYCLRCIPQVHGATRESLKFVRQVLEREANSVTDNPIIFPKEKEILSGGNFHGQMVSVALDLLAIATAELASISERRFEKLINPTMSGLPAFLVKDGGLNSGFMIVQVSAAAIVSENKTLCHPASVDSIPTSADKEDHVSMGAWASRKAATVVTNTRRVLAMELLAACQGLDFLKPRKTTPILEKIRTKIRKQIPTLIEDRPFYIDIQKLDEMIDAREFESILKGI